MAASVSRQGFHARRIPLLDLALWDVVGTVALVVLTARVTPLRTWQAAAIWLALATALHSALGVQVRWLGYGPKTSAT